MAERDVYKPVLRRCEGSIDGGLTGQDTRKKKGARRDTHIVYGLRPSRWAGDAAPSPTVIMSIVDSAKRGGGLGIIMLATW